MPINTLALFEQFPETKVTFIDKTNNEFWPEWKIYSNCSDEEKIKANLREIFPTEVVIDIDDNNQEEYEKIIRLLNEKQLNFYSYKTGSRGYHISLFFNNISGFDKDQRNEIRKLFIKSLGLNENYLHKVSERTVIAIENRPHFKTLNLKELLEEVKGENMMDYEILEACINNLEEKRKINENIKSIDFKDYHLKDPFLNYIKNNIIGEGMQRNNIIFKNLAIALVKEGLSEQEIKELMTPIILKNFPGKHINEFMGWVKKTMVGELKDYNLIEINKWNKEYGTKSEVYDITPITIKESINLNKEPRKKFISDKELEEQQEENIEWIIDKWLPKGDICFLAGKAASFKTTVVLHFIYAISKGKLVFNNYNTKKSKVLYINEENYKKLFKKMIRRVKKGLDLENVKDEDVYFSIMESLGFDNREDVLDIINFINKNNIEVVVFDSFRRFFLGEENDAGLINKIFNTLKYIRNECKDVTIIVLHHAKKDSQNGQGDIRDILRGSSDIVNSADSVIGIKRKHGKDLITIEHIKNRAGEELVGKVIQIESGENKDKAYLYETANEARHVNIKSAPEQCADEIIQFIEDNKLPIFSRKNLEPMASKYPKDTITKALRILIDSGDLISKGEGKLKSYLKG